MNKLKRLAILGAGESGVGAAILAKKEGYEVFVSDYGIIQDEYIAELKTQGIKFEMQGHTTKRILEADHVVKSPGIPDNAPIVKLVAEHGIPVISEVEFAFWYNTAKIVSITGSNGKTTTTNLTEHLLKAGGVNVLKGGNVGDSFARLVAEKSPDVFVLELSSFQLDGIELFRSEISILLNITPDHLDRYDYDFNKYVRSKFRITMNQTKTDLFIYNADNGAIENFLSTNPIRAVKLPVKSTGELASKEADNPLKNLRLNNPALRGAHNRFNAACAVAVARQFNVEESTLQQALDNFANDPHRLELVAIIKGVEYINDSKATNVDATYFAIEAMDRPIIWIAGGTDKGNDYSVLDDLAKDKVKALICLGVDNQKLKDHFGNKIPKIIETQTAEAAIEEAINLADNGDAVLLSPACASFDLFKNYLDRGEQFKEAVLKRL